MRCIEETKGTYRDEVQNHLITVFDISVSELLGVKIESETNQSAMADQLSRINEQLAIKNGEVEGETM